MRAREAMVPVAFQRCSVKASVSLLLLVLVAGGGGWTLLGQGIAEMREKVFNGTFKSPTKTPSTSSRSQDLARVFPMADEPAVDTPNGWGGQSLTNMYDGTPSTAGVEPKTSKTKHLIFAGCIFSFLFFCLALKSWLVKKVKTQNENKQTLSDASLKNDGTSTTETSLRARVHSRSFFESGSQPVSVKAQRLVLLSELRGGELTEEVYFRIVHLTFKKPLQCAQFCDQVKYTKFDPDCSREARAKPVPHTSTPNYKKKTKHV